MKSTRFSNWFQSIFCRLPISFRKEILNPFSLYHDDVDVGVYTHQWKWCSFPLDFLPFKLLPLILRHCATKGVETSTIWVVYYSVVFMYQSRLERHISSSLPYDRKKCTNFACWFLEMIMMLIEVAVCPYFGRCLLILFTLRLKLARTYI